MGLYAPSPARIYPPLERLEAEGLVTQSQEGGRKVYQITDAGREELAGRQDELDELEAEISGSVHGLARDPRRGARHRAKPHAGAEAGGAGDPPRAAPREPVAPRPPRRPSSLGTGATRASTAAWPSSWTGPSGRCGGSN